MLRLITSLTFCFIAFGASAQSPTSNWYFGFGAGIQFNADGSVTTLTDGRLNTFEGCSSISDNDGNLLFYTDGITVYNKNHDVMDNGRGLYGDPSSTQSAIIVAHPGNAQQYFVFTVDTSIMEGDPDRGLNYSLIDMTGGEGLGSVIEKNINLLNDCSEKITAVLKDCMAGSVWVVTLSSPNGVRGVFNTYHAFEVNAEGVMPNSVKTEIPPLILPDPRGYLKFSAEGNVFASANMQGGLFLYDFDKETGTISEGTELLIPNAVYSAYGVEFSPNSQYLYVHAFNDIEQNLGNKSLLLQYDILADDINASVVILDDRPIYRGALQLAENGKIYRTISRGYFNGTSNLGVINRPNEKGLAAEYEHNAISLGTSTSGQGLPPFVQSLFKTIDLIHNPDGSTSKNAFLCEGDALLLSAEIPDESTLTWTKDGNPMDVDEPFLDLTDLKESDSGKYRLEVSAPNSCPFIGEAFIEINKNPDAPPLFLQQCDFDSDPEDGLARFNLRQAEGSDLSYSYYESEEDMLNARAIENPENYLNSQPMEQMVHYKVLDDQGCGNNGMLRLKINPTYTNAATQNTYYTCDMDETDGLEIGMFDLGQIAVTRYPRLNAKFYATEIDATLENNPLPMAYMSGDSDIFLRAEEGNACQEVIAVFLRVNPLPEIEIEEQFWICTDGNDLTLEVADTYDSYSWQSSVGASNEALSNESSVSISDPGTYTLEVGNTLNGLSCSSQRQFTVVASNRAVISDFLVQDLTTNNSIEVLAEGLGDYEYSIDGINFQDSPVFNNVNPGIITVSVRDRNGCGTNQEDVSVLGFNKFFTPNGDNVHNNWRILGAERTMAANRMISIFNRYGRLVGQFDPRSDGWNGMLDNIPLPADDYWFRAIRDNGRTVKGHFTLKR